MLTVRDMAAALGISKSQADRDKAAGMPMTDPASARAWREAHRDMSRTVEGRIDRPAAAARGAAAAPLPAAGSEAGGAGAMAPPAGAAADDAEPDDDPLADDTAEYRRARTEREQIRRDRERLELEKERGRLVDVDDAARIAFTAFRTLRDQAFHLAPRLAAQLAVETDPLVIEQRLAAELAELFGRFDETRLLQDADDADDDASG